MVAGKYTIDRAKYVVTGDRDVTTVLTVWADGRWQLDKGKRSWGLGVRVFRVWDVGCRIWGVGPAGTGTWIIYILFIGTWIIMRGLGLAGNR
jgi:hypothetical protein